jgi:hypothetical protein
MPYHAFYINVSLLKYVTWYEIANILHEYSVPEVLVF